jgi:hypothetical protein
MMLVQSRPTFRFSWPLRWGLLFIIAFLGVGSLFYAFQLDGNGAQMFPLTTALVSQTTLPDATLLNTSFSTKQSVQPFGAGQTASPGLTATPAPLQTPLESRYIPLEPSASPRPHLQ